MELFVLPCGQPLGCATPVARVYGCCTYACRSSRRNRWFLRDPGLSVCNLSSVRQRVAIPGVALEPLTDPLSAAVAHTEARVQRGRRERAILVDAVAAPHLVPQMHG